MNPIPLPHFLLMLCVIVLAAGVTLWFALHSGISLPALGVLLLLAAGVVRLFARVE